MVGFLPITVEVFFGKVSASVGIEIVISASPSASAGVDNSTPDP